MSRVSQAILTELHRNGGRFYSPSGLASRPLKDAIDASTASISTALQQLEADGLIRREIRGKRCFAIELVRMPVVEDEPPAPELDSHLSGPAVDVHALADELLMRCLEVLEGPELARVDAERLSDALEEAGRLRERVRRLEAEAEGRAAEVSSLRQRVRLLDSDKTKLQQNLDQAIAATGRVVDDQVRSRIEKFMQEKPQPGLRSV